MELSNTTCLLEAAQKFAAYSRLLWGVTWRWIVKVHYGVKKELFEVNWKEVASKYRKVSYDHFEHVRTYVARFTLCNNMYYTYGILY